MLAALAAYREARDDDPSLPGVLATMREGFEAGLDDDLNVSASLAALFDGVRELNRRIDQRSLSTDDAAARPRPRSATSTRVLGVAAPEEAALDPELQALLDARAARAREPRLGGVGSAARRARWRGASPSRTRATASAGASW